LEALRTRRPLQSGPQRHLHWPVQFPAHRGEDWRRSCEPKRRWQDCGKGPPDMSSWSRFGARPSRWEDHSRLIGASLLPWSFCCSACLEHGPNGQHHVSQAHGSRRPHVGAGRRGGVRWHAGSTPGWSSRSPATSSLLPAHRVRIGADGSSRSGASVAAGPCMSPSD
jgi:hypothetical protein